MGIQKKTNRSRGPAAPVQKESAKEEAAKKSQRGLAEGLDRKTYILTETNIAKIEWYAYREHTKINAGLNEILETYFQEHPVKKVSDEELHRWKGG